MHSRIAGLAFGGRRRTAFCFCFFFGHSSSSFFFQFLFLEPCLGDREEECTFKAILITVLALGRVTVC